MSSETVQESRKPLKLVHCHGCGSKAFIPGNLAPLESTECVKCGAELMMPMTLEHFDLRAMIASGGMGKVYCAMDQVLEREVAIKLMKRELSEDPEALAGFYSEARACACLNHTNIINLHAFGEFDDQLYLVMELADNGSLDERIEKDDRVAELEVLDIGVKIASALDTALKKDLLHRDIKPGNILFNTDNEPKLIDFGLASPADAGVDYGTQIWGTPYYIAPEKLRREPENFLSDMYSLAGTLYHALTGHVPFEAETVEEIVQAHLEIPVTPPSHVVQAITEPTSQALVRALSKHPRGRFQNYDEFIMALTAARSQLLVGLLQGHSVSSEMEDSPAKASPARGGWWRRKK